MAEMIFNHAPNQKIVRLTLDGTFQLVTGFPGLDAGMRFLYATVRSVAAGNVTDGSPFQFSINQASAPTTGKLVSGAGQTETIAGGAWNMYAKGTNTDVLVVEIFY